MNQCRDPLTNDIHCLRVYNVTSPFITLLISINTVVPIEPEGLE